MYRGRYTRLLCGAAAIALVSAGAAHAEDTRFDIQPQSLSTALNAFSEQASLPVLFKTDMARQKQSPGVSGSADPEIALAQLLQGTGLHSAGLAQGSHASVNFRVSAFACPQRVRDMRRSLTSQRPSGMGRLRV